jgi:hypothetical protein
MLWTSGVWSSLTNAIKLVIVALLSFVPLTSHSRLNAANAPAKQSITALPRVDIYGDSLTWETEYYLNLGLTHRARYYFHVFPGTSLCFWLNDMRKTAAQHPNMVLVTFAVWPGQACDKGTQDPIQALNQDANTVAAIFWKSHVVFAADPPKAGFTQQALVKAAYEAAAAAHENASFNDAASAVAPGGFFVKTLPCMPDESAAMGCRNGRIVVRAPDNVHLCPVISEHPVAGGCSVYSSGERRFATALLLPVMTQFPAG